MFYLWWNRLRGASYKYSILSGRRMSDTAERKHQEKRVNHVMMRWVINMPFVAPWRETIDDDAASLKWIISHQLCVFPSCAIAHVGKLKWVFLPVTLKEMCDRFAAWSAVQQRVDAEPLHKTAYLHVVQCDRIYTRLYLAHTHTHAAVFLGIFGMSFTLQPVHCNTTIHSNLLMKWCEFRWDFIVFPIETWKKPFGVTSVTEMHYILLENKNISRQLAGFHYTETIWSNLSDDWRLEQMNPFGDDICSET